MTKRALRKLAAEIQPETPRYSKFPQGIKKAVNIIPRNLNQEIYLDLLHDPSKLVIVAHGPAGCGKTILAMTAGIKALSEKKVKKLVLTRPAVPAEGEERLGALPGDLNEKMDPYMRPLMDVLLEYYSMKDIETMIENKVIEIIPLSFMRGRNLKNSWIIFDESQNANPNQLKMVLTRLCEGSKIVITGDITQGDRKDYDNGLLCFKTLLKNYGESQYAAAIEFNYSDIERHPVVAEMLAIFGEK